MSIAQIRRFSTLTFIDAPICTQKILELQILNRRNFLNSIESFQPQTPKIEFNKEGISRGSLLF